MKKCLYCGEQLKTVISVHREYNNGITVVINNTPIEMCDSCHEEYFSAEVMEKIQQILLSIFSGEYKRNDNHIIIDYNDVN